MDEIAEIARTVLYEGHILWPYTRSAVKNRQRWTFGGVYPESWSTDGHEDDAWRMRTQCLIDEADADTRIAVHIRFLHIVERQAARAFADGRLEPVDEIEVGGERHLTWTEAMEREIVAPELDIGALADSAHRQRIEIPVGGETEWLADGTDERAGALLRTWQDLLGTLEVRAERLRDGLFRLTVEVENRTPWRGTDRADAQKQSFASLHAVLRIDRRGEFVSLMDPPDALGDAAEVCDDNGWWPVLAGPDDQRRTMLAPPIILYDYPKVAPESPGDLFDGGEIDQLLILSILTLSDEEKEEMRASDPRAREILDRCEELSPEELMRLHGTMRSFGPAGPR